MNYYLPFPEASASPRAPGCEPSPRPPSKQSARCCCCCCCCCSSRSSSTTRTLCASQIAESDVSQASLGTWACQRSTHASVSVLIHKISCYACLAEPSTPYHVLCTRPSKLPYCRMWLAFSQSCWWEVTAADLSPRAAGFPHSASTFTERRHSARAHARLLSCSSGGAKPLNFLQVPLQHGFDDNGGESLPIPLHG